MRKILLATSALVALAGAAQAAESPIQVTLGGYVDFRAALFHEAQKIDNNSATTDRRQGDFATEYGVSIAAEGKAAGGIEYGAKILLDNVPTQYGNAPASQVAMDQAYVWMSGAFGKVLMGDEHGASDLFVVAPTVGEGQIDGNYTLFTDATTLARFKPAFIDTLENNTKFTYYTPKVGNANHKVQLGVSYTPNAEIDQGALGVNGNNVGVGNNVALYRNNITSYSNVVETSAQYTGNFSPVNVVVSPMVIFAEGQDSNPGVVPQRQYRDATIWGIGAQAMYAGFTFGGSYVDAGHYNTIKEVTQDKDQNVWSLGLKYEFDKVAVAANYMNGEGYFPLTDGANVVNTYVDDFSAVGVGATYTWFPGLTSAADAVFFDQNRQDSGTNNIGQVLMLSQKMAF